MIKKLSIFGTIGTISAISIIGVGILTFTRPAATAYVSPKASEVIGTTQEAPAQPATPVVPVEVVAPVVEPSGTTVQVVITAPVAPVVLSTQAYANMYIDLVTNYSGFTPQQCLDAIISRWPERFTEANRENNIKALRVWDTSGVCATGILDWPRNTNLTKPILRWGQNGEFFDSPIAISYH